MYRHSTNYAKEDGLKPGQLVHRGFWAHEVPRLMLWCRARGHRPVVDGHGPIGPDLRAARWVCCDRCGVRPEPQGSPDPEKYAVGDPYTGPYLPVTRMLSANALFALLGLKSPPTHADDQGKPGPWPDKPSGTLGAELLVGKTFGVFSIGVELGAAGNEHTLAAHLRINPLGSIYLHTDRFGAWLQRRLIPTGYDSRIISVGLGDWRIRWQLWAVSNGWSRDTPRWRDGSLNLDLMERMFGPKRYNYEVWGHPVLASIHLAEGESYQVRLQLKRVRFGRPKSRRPKMSWMVEWDSGDFGIPFRNRSWKGNTLGGSSVAVSDKVVERGEWQGAAQDAIVKTLMEKRARYGYSPEASA